MADLKFVDQHNMVAYLEKSDENAEFHQIVDFLSTCSINYALTVSPTIYASYIEQFWNTATSKTINSVKQIYAIVDGKAVVISESSVRSDLLFNDEDGVTCLTNDEIFENLALMGYEQLSTKLTFQKAHIEQILLTLTTYQGKRKTQKHRRTKRDTELPQTSVPLNYGTYEAVHKEGGDSVERAITTVASLDAAHDIDNIIRTETTTMPNTRSERVLEQPSEPPLSEGHTSGSGEGSMEHIFELTDNVPPTPHDLPLTGGYTLGSDEGRMKLDELITLCTKLSKQVLDLEKEKDAQAVEILNLKRRVKKLERKRKSSISHPRRRKYRKVKTSSDDGLDGEDASNKGGEFDAAYKLELSTVLSTISTTGTRDSSPSSTTVFDDEDVTMVIDQTLIKMKEQKAKEKGVAIADVEDSSRTVRPVRSITTLQPLPTIDPKDKELAQRLYEEELTELKRRQKERVAQEEASMAALYEEYDTIQASIDADALFAAKLQQEEREQFTIEERA
ncbi:hypothetical protein Tco_0973430 [Tanacetum coccineum]